MGSSTSIYLEERKKKRKALSDHWTVRAYNLEGQHGERRPLNIGRTKEPRVDGGGGETNIVKT